VLTFYGTTSEVPWLFLLADWILALIVCAAVYAAWNYSGLRLHIRLKGSVPGHGSPIEELPENLLRSGPLPAPVFEGDGLELEVGIDTTGAPRGPAWIKGKIDSSEIAIGVGLVPRSGWRHVQTIHKVRRGPVSATSWTVTAGDPVGLFSGRRRRPDAEAALVLPRFATLNKGRLVHELEAVAAAPRAGSGTELFGVREYRPGDSLRRIHWRSSARLGELVVREFEPPGVQTLGIFVDPSPRSIEVADQIARLAASEAWDCIREGGRVVLWGPGLEATQPSEARDLWALLEWLARYPATSGAFAGASPASGEVVAVTAGDPHVLAAMEDAKARGVRVRAWVVGDAELDIDADIQRVGTAWPL
jgi:uncharacterized protein (DUF58 family)